MPDSNSGGGMWNESSAVQLYAETLESHSDLQAALDVAVAVALETVRQHAHEFHGGIKVIQEGSQILISIARE